METITVEKEKIKVGEVLPETLRHHIKKYVSTTDYGYVAHLNKISQHSVDRLFRNELRDRTPVTENTLPAVIDLIELALLRLEEEKKGAQVSKRILKSLIKK